MENNAETVVIAAVVWSAAVTTRHPAVLSVAAPATATKHAVGARTMSHKVIISISGLSIFVLNVTVFITFGSKSKKFSDSSYISEFSGKSI